MNNSKNFQTVHSKPFDEAREKYTKAERLMLAKKRMIDQLPPRGSAFYRYFSDPSENPAPYYKQVERIENLTYEDVFGADDDFDWRTWQGIEMFPVNL
jgi:hypothetical protein